MLDGHAEATASGCSKILVVMRFSETQLSVRRPGQIGCMCATEVTLVAHHTRGGTKLVKSTWKCRQVFMH